MARIVGVLNLLTSPFVAVGFVAGAIYCALDYGFWRATEKFKTRMSWF